MEAVLHSTSSVIVSRVLWKLCYTPQALSLFLESWDSVLCLPLCLCPFLLVYCPPVYIYCSGLGTFPSVSFPPLQVSSFAVLPLILVSFPPLQSPWCSVTQGPFESRFFNNTVGWNHSHWRTVQDSHMYHPSQGCSTYPQSSLQSC